ncbi:MAG: hypothetical protein Q9180_003252 [Flavoplaca navasiana]
MSRVASLFKILLIYLDTTVTNLWSTTTLANTTWVTSSDYAKNPIPATPLYGQALVTKELQGNETITAGVTVQSPDAFYVFSTIKVIWVPAVVDNTNGQVSCGTISTYLDPLADLYDEKLTTIFSNINEHVEAYFDDTPAPNFYEHGPWYLEHGRPTPVASTYNNPAPYNSTKISFPTPFVHLPHAVASERDATIAVDAVAPCKESLRFNISRLQCSQDQIPGHSDYLPANKPWHASFHDVAEDYGHVPQALLDWMLKDPLNVAQFPDLAACLPGGPSIIVQYDHTGTIQATSAMKVQEPVAALTIRAENVVDVAGCFNPGACPIIPVSNNRAGTPARASAHITRDHPPVANVTSSGEIPSSPPRPPLDKEWKAPSSDQVPPNAQTPFGGMSGPPREIPLDGQPTTPLQDWAAADTRPQSGDAFSPSGKPLLNNRPATPGDRANAKPQANFASLIMKAFSSAVSAAVLNRASPKVESPISTTEGPPSSTSGKTYSAVPIESTSLDNVAVNNSLSPQSSYLIETGSIGSPVIIAGNTIQPGTSVTISGTTYALPSSSTGILVNGSPSPLPPPFDPAKSRPSASDEVALASVTAASYSIIPGAPGITISGTTYSRPATGTEVFINGSPSPITSDILDISAILLSRSQTLQPSPPIASSSPSNLPNTAQPQSALVMASQTLQPGQAITVFGNIISLPSIGISQIVVDGQTQTLIQITSTASDRVSGIVFTNSKESFTANFVEATSTASVKNQTGTSTSNDVESGSGIANESGVVDEETGSPSNQGPTNGSAGGGSGTESLAVRNRKWMSQMDRYMLGMGILVVIMTEM